MGSLRERGSLIFVTHTLLTTLSSSPKAPRSVTSMSKELLRAPTKGLLPLSLRDLGLGGGVVRETPAMPPSSVLSAPSCGHNRHYSHND